MRFLNRVRIAAIASITCSIGLCLATSAGAAETAEQRARIVESSLKDLSAANDAAIARQRLEPVQETDALGSPRVVLKSEPAATADSRVRTEVQSSLHRLRRETVSQQIEDGRKARVDESLERAARPEP